MRVYEHLPVLRHDLIFISSTHAESFIASEISIISSHMEHLFDPANPMMNVRGGNDDSVDNDDDDDGDNSTRMTTCSILHTPQQQQQQRRLTNAKVREIFECLYNHVAAPPPKIPIPFTIVPVNSNGKALSPPSYEFECRFHNVCRLVCGLDVSLLYYDISFVSHFFFATSERWFIYIVTSSEGQ